MRRREIERIEVDLILEAVLRRHGYDFRGYTVASIKRRLQAFTAQSGLASMSELLPRLLHDEGFFRRFVHSMSVTVTEMFRDPEVYAAIREHVVPILKTYPFVKIWHAGCATGEEAYSLAVVLAEEGFLDRVRIYATDVNTESLATAEEGLYPLEKMRTFSENHQRTAPKREFSDFYSAAYDSARMDASLRGAITFSHHNLVTDGVFGEMNLILCRNVLIYFGKELKERVFRLFRDSLVHRGLLCLGSKESLSYTSAASYFEPLVEPQRIYRRR